ncbi:MAG TPA: hypothetical protein VGK73_14605 [Polyangiaceae bacterium]
MKFGLALAASLGGILVAGSALAQGFQAQTGGGFSTSAPPGYYPPPPKALDNVGEDGQFIFSIERITGVFFDRQSLEYTSEGVTYEDTIKGTSFGLFGVDSDSPSALPRFALDYVFFRGLTAGATFMISTRGYSLDHGAGLPPATSPATAPDGLTVVAGGRVGYAYAFDETFGIWPRAGLSYATTSSKSELVNPEDGESLGLYTSEAHFLQANLELLGAISPVEHIVLFAGPYLDLGLAGGYSLEKAGMTEDLDRRDNHLTSFGFLIHAAGYY